MKECITHHRACDCREARIRGIMRELIDAMDDMPSHHMGLEDYLAVEEARTFLAEPWPGKKDERIKE